jgi:hypothetical protein
MFTKYKFEVGQDVIDHTGKAGVVVGRFRPGKAATLLGNPSTGTPVGHRLYAIAYRFAEPCAVYGTYATCSVFNWEESFLEPAYIKP